MNLFRKHIKGWAVRVALIALLFQALLPLAQAIPVKREDGTGFDSLIICTSYGIKVVQLSDETEQPDEDTSQTECPLCIVHNLKISLPDVEIPVQPSSLSACSVTFRFIDDVDVRSVDVTQAAIRAPPAIA